jgi:coenzyme F420 hydrogenase subunit beta
VIRTKAKNRPVRKQDSVLTIVDHKICCGCGACYVVCPENCIEFVYGSRYNYPRINLDDCRGCGKCLKVCPSAFLLKGTDPGYPSLTGQKDLNCYLAHSPDDDVRLDASSGGFITGLILHLMKKGHADGAIVARCEGEDPWIAKSFIATTREELLSARASKYAPVSSCVTLKEALEKPGRYVFVGTPCMIEGLRKIQNIIPEMKERIVLAIGLVCAGMASRQSTIAFLQRYDVKLNQAYKIVYRGGGWPGYFRVFNEKGQTMLKKPLLGGSLDIVVPGDHYLRCWNCLDHWARFSDIAVSDPWCNGMIDNETKGWSGVMVRTRSGQEAVDSSISDGDIVAKNIFAEEMYGYNKHLIITSRHPRHAWMALYQLIFFGRLNGLKSVVHNLIRKKGVGLLTTLRARFNQNYYENESVRRKLLRVQPGATEHLRKRSEIAHNKYESIQKQEAIVDR